MPTTLTRCVGLMKISTNATRERYFRDRYSSDYRRGANLHEIVFYAAAAWMTVLLAVGVVAVIRVSATTGRILALDMLTLILAALLVLYGDATRSAYYLDAALILALLAFVGTLAAARYHGERKIF